jgi:hypothetical protein
MGWHIPTEDFSPAHEDEEEDEPEAEAPIDQAEEIPETPPMDIFIDDEDD